MIERFRFMFVLVVLVGVVGQADALSQFALLTGNRCINCHITTQGGAQRDELGQYTMDGVGLLAPNYILPGKTAYAQGMLLVGADLRGQMARSHVSVQAERRVFPMQAAIYSVLRPSKAVKFEGSFNFGPKKYDGQRAWTASVIYQPNYNWPQLRVGHYQPPIGMRYDDHTMLVRQTPDVAGASSLIAPNYAEYGAEVHYYRKLWLSLTAGIYSARALAENRVTNENGLLVSLIQDRDKPSYLGRVVLWPKLVEQKLNFYLGGSYLKNDDFQLTNLFGGVGLQDKVAVMGEYVFSDKEAARETTTATLDLSIQAKPGLIIYARGEQGEVTQQRASTANIELTTRQAVLGAQVFLTPQIELRPEYRLLDTETFRSTRYALQVHVFY
ncbi:MAG: hypothetical protein QGG64_24650 [Candidatus Latescibacteria bacterium]|nr:hypothetical protein [Candidatus Latescibacterota bacterium]